MASFKTPTYAAQIASKLGISPALRVDGTYYSSGHPIGFVREYFLTDTSGASAGDSGSDSAGRTIDIDQNDTLQICIIPKGAVLIPGRVAFGAMGSSATLILGLYAYDEDEADCIGTVIDADLCLASEDVSSAGSTTTCTLDVAPEQLGYALTADAVLVATCGGANYATAKYLTIYQPWIAPVG